MSIVCRDMVAELRAAWRCEWCWKRTPNGCELAHVFTRCICEDGHPDMKYNMVSLCLQCYKSYHEGNRPTHVDLIALVDKR